MSKDFSVGAITSDAEMRSLSAIITQCFLDTPEGRQTYVDRVGIDQFRVIRQGQTVVGGLALLPMGQSFGGKLVSTGGIASVGIAPEHRGSGAAIALMHQTLKELQSSGVALSTLYPATQRLYRNAGYEQAGAWCKWEIDASTIHLRELLLPIVPVPMDFSIFRPIYNPFAQQTNGMLDRHKAIWQGTISSDGKESLYAYQVGEPDPQGYIIFSQEKQSSGLVLRVKDWVALTPAASKSLWAFLASHRSIINKIEWKGATIDPLTLLLPEQTAKLTYTMRWLLRIVDVVNALEQRGYPATLNAELQLDVRDDRLRENHDRFILSVSNGHAQVKRGGNGNLALDIRSLSPLYSGLFSPGQLRQMGYLEADEATVAIATAIFAGAPPWMPDFF